MDRLTSELKDYCEMCTNKPLIGKCDIGEACFNRQMWRALKEYELLNLTLEEIKKQLAELTEFKQLEEQGRLVKLRLADMQKVYIHDIKYGTVFEGHIEHRNSRIKNGKLQMCVIVPDHMGMIMYFTEEDIGKTVFLSAEEAEKARGIWMKDDEKKLLTAIYNKGMNSVRDIINEIEIPFKRCIYLLEKWCIKGWYDYGVTIDLGWLTEEGRLETEKARGGE